VREGKCGRHLTQEVGTLKLKDVRVDARLAFGDHPRCLTLGGDVDQRLYRTGIAEAQSASTLAHAAPLDPHVLVIAHVVARFSGLQLPLQQFYELPVLEIGQRKSSC
jgi:hypothetical protein